MSLILAVEPDRRQAAHLTHIVRQKVGVELILAETTELALAQIGSRVPDLILVPALLSPTDDAALAAALRVIATAAHVQMLTTPLFASAAPAPRRGMLSAFRRSKPTKPATDGCDPTEFAQQISSYLEAAAEQRAAAQFIEPPLPVPASTPPPAAAATQQRYVPLEPGRLYRDEGAPLHEFPALPAVDVPAEPAAAWTETEPAAEMAEPVAETEALKAYDTPLVDTLTEPMALIPDEVAETSEPMLETPEPVYATPEPVFEAPAPILETQEAINEAPEPVQEPEAPVLEMPEPILEAPEPIYASPEPVFETREPIYETPVPVYEAPVPVYEASVPVYEPLETVYEPPPEAIFQPTEPVYEAPEPVYETPEPIQTSPEPLYEASALTYEASEAIQEPEAAVLETPEPILEAAEPTFEASETIFETPEPIFETPEPTFETPAPALETPEPLRPAFSRRIGFVVRDQEPELAPLAADSLDIDFEPIEIASSGDTDFVLEGFSEPLTTFSSSLDDEAIELVDVDLSTALSEFDEPHVIEAQSDAEVVELFETPAIVYATEAAAPEVHALEFDALKEFAATLEAMTASEQAVPVSHHTVAADKPFEFDDLFPHREPVDPSPLSAWRCWMPLEGIAAEAMDAPVPARVVERSVEKPQAPERPEWVQLVESLRIDVERRRAEQQPSAAPAAPARKPTTRPIQDEWGLFDPAQCGFAALLDKLEEITEANESRPRRSA